MPPPRTTVRRIVAILFIAAGISHLRSPAAFEAIVPPGWGDAHWDVLFSGVGEISGGTGLLISPVRRLAGYGLCLLLLAVWPANWYMALSAQRFARLVPAYVLWLRLPLQILIIALVAYAADIRRPTSARR